MARVEVRQLRYKGEPAKIGRVEFAVTDALRTEVVDDGRLVLVRSFRLGRIGLTERGASRATANAWQATRQSARHGGASGAESANCVWFADAAEARVLLMRELASGRMPLAWFWTLAVPDWRSAPLAQWLGRRLDEAASDASGEAMATLVADALAGGCVETVVAAIAARVPPLRGGDLRAAVDEGERQARGPRARATPGSAPYPVDDLAGHVAAAAIVRAIPASLRTILAALAGRTELAEFVETLARGLVRRTHPALALVPARLVAVAAAVVHILRFGEPPAPDIPGPLRTVVGEAPGPVRKPVNQGPPPAPDREPPPTRSHEPVTVDAAPADTTPPDPVSTPADLFQAELSSTAAGLFLVIGPLRRLGWREWLAARPHLLLHQPGPRLLRRIAAHHRVPASDPLWHQLPPVDPADEPPTDLEQALQPWRKGLDGWLRRTARLRLAELVLRRGWILPGVETTLVRFPLEAIEIRLRRLALDGDPGWVDWLGHSYRLVYRDRPLLGPELA